MPEVRQEALLPGGQGQSAPLERLQKIQARQIADGIGRHKYSVAETGEENEATGPFNFV